MSTTVYWMPSEADARGKVEDLWDMGVVAQIGAPAAVWHPSGGEVLEWPVYVVEAVGDWLARELERTELDEHDVGRSTLWDEE